ncbi:hypothetical protein H2203_003965 [Taxawa tesnikishii (nom. ined.)]|nr:hypothetical protein H2203_003965 [Dothideales sp. JES 119]
MNNQQFRRLVLDTPARQDGASGGSPKPGSVPSSLGSKRSSFVPMTPRTVRGSGGVDFARQLAERDSQSQPTKKFRSAAAPRGTKLGAGYRDRTLDRQEQDEADDKAARIKALEEQMKLGQIEPEVFERLRDQITGGDVGSTHLVKGLDRRLLERVRRGEDVLNGSKEDKSSEPQPDVDDEFEKLEEQEVAPVEREKVVKRGDMAPPPPIAGIKRSRNDILAELKAQRLAAKTAAEPAPDARFRDIGAQKQQNTRIQHEHGNVKKKVRKVQQSTKSPVAEKPVKFLDEGVLVPEIKKVAEPEEEDDDDIFEGAGTEYNPLGDEDEDEDEDMEAEKAPVITPPDDGEGEEEGTQVPPPQPTSKPRNYFKSTPLSQILDDAPQNPLSDPNFLAAVKRAGSLANFKLNLEKEDQDRSADDGEDPEAKEARLKRRAQMLAQVDRDLEDIDMGFGESSEWKGVDAADNDEDEGAEGGGERTARSHPRAAAPATPPTPSSASRHTRPDRTASLSASRASGCPNRSARVRRKNEALGSLSKVAGTIGRTSGRSAANASETARCTGSSTAASRCSDGERVWASSACAIASESVIMAPEGIWTVGIV